MTDFVNTLYSNLSGKERIIIGVMIGVRALVKHDFCNESEWRQWCDRVRQNVNFKDLNPKQASTLESLLTTFDGEGSKGLME